MTSTPGSAAPTAVATRPSPDARLLRFGVGERVLHWVNAALMMVMLATGSALYFPSLSEVVGRRGLVLQIHVYAGLALPVPLLLAAIGSQAFREDVRRLNRWTADDRRWFRGRSRRGTSRVEPAVRPGVRLGKFNPGQKLNAAWTVGVIVVMLATGLIMRFPDPWPVRFRTGATFVHDWVYLAAGIVVVGHIGMAVSDRDALRSMWSGWIPSRWARRHAPAWVDELELSEPPPTL